jgi:hypothetical protein
MAAFEKMRLQPSKRSFSDLQRRKEAYNPKMSEIRLARTSGDGYNI